MEFDRSQRFWIMNLTWIKLQSHMKRWVIERKAKTLKGKEKFQLLLSIRFFLSSAFQRSVVCKNWQMTSLVYFHDCREVWNWLLSVMTQHLVVEVYTAKKMVSQKVSSEIFNSNCFHLHEILCRFTGKTFSFWFFISRTGSYRAVSFFFLFCMWPRLIAVRHHQHQQLCLQRV